MRLRTSSALAIYPGCPTGHQPAAKASFNNFASLRPPLLSCSSRTGTFGLLPNLWPDTRATYEKDAPKPCVGIVNSTVKRLAGSARWVHFSIMSGGVILVFGIFILLSGGLLGLGTITSHQNGNLLQALN